MFEQAQTELATLRDLLRFAVSRFNEAGLFFGHGADNAWDEAVYLLLHSLHLPLRPPRTLSRREADQRGTGRRAASSNAASRSVCRSPT
jgi:methylase of polypeptide subunit release factors